MIVVLHLGDIQKHVFNEQLVPTFLENFQAFNLLTKSPKQQSLNSMEEVIYLFIYFDHEVFEGKGSMIN